MILREKAERIFAWGLAERSKVDSAVLVEKWRQHSFAAAKVAETIAEKCGMDGDKAYVMGLLHDIGRYPGKQGHDLVNHVILGYRKMMEEGEPEVARICMTHSFWPKEKLELLDGGDPQDVQEVRDFVHNVEYDDYDKLIVLADYMSGAHGITMIERRFCSVLMRHGAKDPRGDLIALMDLKDYFDEKTGVDIYELFREEITDAVFRGRPGGKRKNQAKEVAK